MGLITFLLFSGHNVWTRNPSKSS